MRSRIASLLIVFCLALGFFLSLSTDMDAQGSPSVVGRWTFVGDLPYFPPHVHVLPTGKVMLWPGDLGGAGGGGSGNDVRLWDPASGLVSVLTPPNWDLFCSGHVFLADGRLFVAGGHIENGVGLPNAATYDPFTDLWSDLPSMSAGRWYPTATLLGSGDVLVVSGSVDDNVGENRLPGVFQVQTDSWRDLTGAQLSLGLYPRMHLAPDGTVVNTAPSPVTRALDTSGTGQWTFLGNRAWDGNRDYGSSVMYAQGKVLVAGGGDPPTDTAEVLDLTANPPAWHQINSMSFARRQQSTTILPDGKVLISGGTSGNGFNNPNNPVYASEMWDPSTENWSLMASAQIARIYHSATVLLSDGRVLSTGGNGTTQTEIYEPPYLFRGARPTISSAPSNIGFGQSFFVQTPDSAGISQVTMLTLSSATHAFDMNQRIAHLSFTPAAGGLNVTAPANGNLAPPGYYMLFILNSNGVPSVSKMVKLGAAGSTEPVVSSISPGSAALGGPAFTLTVNGSNFVSGSVVRWNNSPRSTTFVNPNQLTASISASDIGGAGSQLVTVENPGGAVSNAMGFAVNSFVVTPAAIPEGGDVTATWSGISDPSAGDWIALYSPNSPNTSYIDWMFVNCTKVPGGGPRASGSCAFTVPSEIGLGGYQLRLLSNSTYNVIAVSNIFSITSGATITVSPTTVAPGGTVTVAWEGDSNANREDFIGLFRPGADNLDFIDWVYVSCTKTPDDPRPSGSCPFTLPGSLTQGNFQMRLLAAESATLLAGSNGFTIGTGGGGPGVLQFGSSVFSAPENGGSGGVTIVRTGGSTGAVSVTVSTSNGTAGSSDYTPVSQVVSFADGETSTKTVSIPILDDGLTEGTETVNLALSNPSGAPLGNPAAAVLNIIDNESSAPMMTVTPTSVAAGASVTATWSGNSSPTTFDWIGLYAVGAGSNEWLEWLYVSCTKTAGSPRASGSCAFPIPAELPAGSYELRLFSNGTFSVIAPSNVFAVTLGGMSVTPGVISPGGTVTTSWSGLQSPTGFDWIGLYASGTDNNAWLEWIYVSCTKTAGSPRASGSCPFTVPGGLPAGNYELRLYSNGTFSLLGAADFAIGASPGTLQLSAAAYSVAEGGGNAVVTVTRTGGSAGAVGVTLATSNGTAAAGSDYTAVSQTVSFANGDTTAKTVNIPIANDTSDEPDETVNVTLSSATGGATVGTPGSAVLTIVDDDVAPAGTLQLSAAAYSVAEGGGNAVVTVTRTGGSAGAVGVTLATSNGTAAAGSDYTAVSQTVSFANGDTTAKTVNIPIANDTSDEPDETVNVTLSSATGGATVGTPGSAVLTITDDDDPPIGTLQFSAAAYGVAEGNGTAVVTITRTGGGFGPVSASFATSNGTATAGSDYTAVSQTVSFANGDIAAKTVSIAIANDTAVESSETINLTLSNPTGGATLGTPAAAVLTITDDDVAVPGTVQFSAGAYGVGEGDGDAVVTVTRSGGSEGAISVTLSTSNGTAAAGSDYTAVSQSVSFTDGDTTAKTVHIPILNDTAVESGETINLALSSPTGGAGLGSPSNAVLTITDDDVAVPGTLQFSAANFTAGEGDGTAVVTVTRAGGSGGAVSVTLATSNGTAVAGSDYTAVSQTVSFANGDTTAKTVAIPLTADLSDESDETVNLTLNNPMGGASLGSPSTAVLTITDDDDAGTLQLGAAAYNAAEGAGIAAVTVTRTGGSAGAVSVMLATSNGTATAGSDYTAVSQTVSFAAGDAAPKTVNITIANDAADEPDETVNLTLSNAAGGATLGTPSTAVLTIADDDDPLVGTLQLSAAAYSVGEGGGNGVVTVTRTGGSAGAVSVTLATSNGTATAGSDYTAVNQAVSFADGDAAPKTVNIPITNDTSSESDETINVALSSPTGGATLGTPNAAVLTITDNDAPVGTLQFSTAAYSIGEGGGSGVVTVTRTGGSAGAVSVSFATSNGTATAGSDYTAVSQTVSFANGDSAAKTINVPITNDTAVEANETINLTLSSPTGGATLGTPNAAVLTITDNDAPAGSLQFSTAAFTVGEGGGNGVVTVTRTGGSAGAVSASFATSNGTATAGSDYTAVSQTVSFANGDTTAKTINIPITNDAAVESSETINLALSSPTGGATLGTPSAATLTITDNDTAPAGSLQFSTAAFTVGEGGGNGVVTVTRTGGSAGAVGVTFATSNGTATAGSDYTAVSQTVSFANGDTTSKTVNVPIVNDATVEANETINLTLSSPTGGATLGAQSTATLTITDNDTASPSLSVTPATIVRGNPVTVSWSGIGAPSAFDWISIYAAGASDMTITDWMYVSCSKTAGSAQSSGSCSFTVPSSVSAGTYEFRIFSNGTYTRLATSNAFTVTAPAGVTLTVTPTTIVRGNPVTVAWSGIGSPTSADWISFNTVGSADQAFLDWMYVSCSKAAGSAAASGSCSFAIPAGLSAGTYEFRIFSNGTYTRLATSNSFTVTAPAGVTLGVTPTTIARGSAVTVNWSGIASPTAADWISLYTVGASDQAFVDWMYVSCSKTSGSPRASGSCSFVIPAGATAGSYEMRIFTNATFTRLATSNSFTVTAGGGGLSFSAAPGTVSRGAPATATWSGIASPTASDWIGMYVAGSADTALIDWEYVSCSKSPGSPLASGSCAIAVPLSASPGTYEFRLFSNATFNRLATSNTFTVTAQGAALDTGGSLLASLVRPRGPDVTPGLAWAIAAMEPPKRLLFRREGQGR